MEQKYLHGANIPWTAPHHKNFSSDRENFSGDRDSCDPDTCLLYLPQPHSNPSPFTHARIFYFEIIQLTGRPPYKYPTAQSCIATLNAAKSTNSWPSSIGPGMVCRGTWIRREQYRLIVRRAWDSDSEGTVSVDCTKSLGLGFGGNSVG